MSRAMGVAAAVRGSVVVGAVLGLGLFACAPSANHVVAAPIDVAVGSVKEAPPLVASGKGANETCTVWLTAEPIEKSSPGCYMDQHVSEEVGVLRYPCSGEGAADAQFGEHHYEGKVVGGRVNLELDTELDWEDGCRWGTHHVIRGELSKGDQPAEGKLSWRYADRVLSGSDCSGKCTAKTELALSEPTGNSPPTVRLRPIEEDETDDSF